MIKVISKAFLLSLKILKKLKMYLLRPLFKSYGVNKVGSIPDIIRHRITGLLIEKKNINQLVDNLEILITDSELRRNLALNAKEQVNRNDSVDVGIRKFKTLFGI